MHEESDSETEPVTINQCFGVVEPPCDFCDFHWGRSMVVPFFFPAKGRVCCTSHRSVHLMHTESIWHISFPQQAHKTASTVKDTTYECFKIEIQHKKSSDELVHHEGDFSCYLSLGSRQVTTSPRADVKTCWVAPGCEMLRRQGSWMRRLGRWTVFRLCFLFCLFSLGLVLRFFLLLFSYGFVGSVFFFVWMIFSILLQRFDTRHLGQKKS